MTVSTVAELEALISRVKAAQEEYSTFSQEKVDEIFRMAALKVSTHRIELAKMAVEETGMGIMEDKVIKNHFASEFIYSKYATTKTCDEVSRNDELGTVTLSEPMGIICAIIPTTNPTSTAIFKTLMALKTRNACIIAPHPRAKKCTNYAAQIVLEAAVKAGAPKDIIGWIDVPSLELTNTIMKHKDTAVILATGGPGMVKAAYSSGNPAIGVGAGNTPVVIDETADLKRAVSSILMSKTFDNGMICASEQAVIVVESQYDAFKARLEEYGAVILNKKDADKVANIMFIDGALNAKIVGQTAYTIAKLAGVKVPTSAKILVGEGDEVTVENMFAHEKLSPTLGLFKARDYDHAVIQAQLVLDIGGVGHTAALYTDQDANSKRVDAFGVAMKACRILINSPTSHGGIGDLYNFGFAPSLTLGCGSHSGNAVSENVGPQHLLNTKTIAKRAENMLWHKLPKSIYFRRGCLPIAMTDLADKKRAMIVTDGFLFANGYVDSLVEILKAQGTHVEVFHQVEADPTLSIIKKGAAALNAFNPDVILAVGGGSPMDAAKIMWVLYEHPETNFEDLAMRFMDIRKRIYKFPKMGIKADLVCITTTSGTGSEVTPFAVVTDDETGKKYPLADYELTPTMAVIDANLVMDMPKSLCAFGGYDAVTHAIEAYVSILANEYSDGQALQALKLLKEFLPSSYHNGKNDAVAREKVHNAATIAGMAFAQSFLGVCHSMAHKLGNQFHIPHGLANALLLTNTIRYNATNKPTKQGTFSQYDRPKARARYAEIAIHLGFYEGNTEDKINSLLTWLEELKVELNIPLSIRDAGVNEADFLAALDDLAEQAFDDQCTGANPRYPLIAELKEVLLASYYGTPYVDVMDAPVASVKEEKKADKKAK
ncbi:bifunctional acetaldehyde-CoA/alcohol dehydrogenase [Psychromonas sp. CNPT3]|uniref:bifunctional acetaldehyde-CoA/alcohol dehydrogenase n=1 Tax=Psychromonas sp. CNPT3 TaxID=314282 RepID=UPI00006E763A|nr:bifunctional acetaldehyde-CoA/alcohol dehydrogenase [Psychromonas sp. CNPT3]AGH80331.1 bifunctional acetaldehyde-CoA/alcohol dehydrogenase [Psychromonas sp. CNPT3]